MGDRLRQLEEENETLRALLFLNNVRVQLNNPSDTDNNIVVVEGDVKSLKELIVLRERVVELRAVNLLMRADAVVLRDQTESAIKEAKQILRRMSIF